MSKCEVLVVRCVQGVVVEGVVVEGEREMREFNAGLIRSWCTNKRPVKSQCTRRWNLEERR